MHQLFFWLACFFTFLTLIGLYKPWIVFWWADFSNRKKVLKIYGGLMAICWVVYGLLS